ncbi:MAG: hypothetical protein OMM_04690 [Candidatus Magnetoglobus multicellularis str. Araruama]|uniref:Bacterial repeat domain-containing protein n=1 Tax=Candidatus Magnetoglobus multicellularis str. Araruama TaxID=890399 RepID=A0A1V1P0E2_9BACT|nr:MAG: hypothetical protein OMM_04690 [Candidatus Magnetoglobus multicellularis str. Araruama]
MTQEIIPEQTIDEDTQLQLTVYICGADGDDVTISTLSTNALLVLENPPEVYHLQNQIPLVITPSPNQNGSATITVLAIDTQGYTAQTEFQLTIVAVNDPPELSAIPNQIIAPSVNTINIPFTVFDIDTEYSDLTFDIQSSNPSIIPNDRIRMTGTGKDRLLEITPLTSVVEMTDIHITVSDSGGLTSSTGFTISGNRPPIISNREITLDEDKFVHILIKGSDEENDPLTYTVVNLPAHGTITIDGDIATYQPDLNFNGIDRFSYKANDGFSDSTIADVLLTIYAINDPPVAENLFYQITENTEKLLISFPHTDIDGDTLVYNIVSFPQHGSISKTSSDLMYKPEDWFWGTDTLVYTLSDGQCTSTTATVNIAIERASQYVLNISEAEGNGSIQLNGTDIILPWSELFDSDTRIMLEAIPLSDWVFDSWSGDQVVSSINPLPLTMNRGMTIKAHFVPPMQRLTLLGHQDVMINDEILSLPIEKMFYRGTQITMTGIPQQLFVKWAGDLSGSENPKTITIETPMTIGLVFTDPNEWQAVVRLETSDLPDIYTDEITIGVSVLATTEPDQLSSVYACSLLVYSSDNQNCRTDIRENEGTEYHWVIAVNPHGNMGSFEPRKAVLQWNPNQFSSEGYYRLYEGYNLNGNIVVSDMRSVNTFTVSGGDSMQYFTIVWSSYQVKEFHYITENGWNLISLPLLTDNSQLNHLFPDAAIAYEFIDGAYVSAEQLEPGKGYWIKVTKTGYDITGKPLKSQCVNFSKGWHLIGVTDNQVYEPLSMDCIESIYTYDKGAYRSVLQMLPGKGYWVKFSKNCDLCW